ncbi:peptide chain release factor N(5)-glutamine methyltransferase [Hymenobacter nivis]|uniref:peptide chain release factor N(5)-glutamine methyltransferase n=1 Tax=Hymenobacter nivis TaxID=1850093 RepID=A0A502GPG7_9BACT|nr:peptide chain release factor N(5)-glutamine methyltransferase [Hymenobacter nivis]TPG62896.1 peptide chain release factor N(5)-glutamine methyltransferase [Hymenobacter nivis]
MTTRALTDHLALALAAAYPAPEAAAIAALVAEHLLGLDPLQRRMRAQEAVPAAVQQLLPALEARLLAHEPVQYVLGTAHFAGMELEVTPATLIPRPETEELARLVAAERPGGPTVLDVGTGSGCLALALARALPRAQVLAVDISAEALAVARRNAARYAPQVQFQQVDILQEAPDGLAPGALAVLVSNPPYVRESERAQMRANVLEWEPAGALFVPDADPLLFYRRLGALGRTLLRPGGGLYLEINEALSAETEALLVAQGYTEVRGVADMFGRPRMVRAVAP